MSEKNKHISNAEEDFIVFKIPDKMKAKEPNVELEKLYEQWETLAE